MGGADGEIHLRIKVQSSLRNKTCASNANITQNMFFASGLNAPLEQVKQSDKFRKLLQLNCNAAFKTRKTLDILLYHDIPLEIHSYLRLPMVSNQDNYICISYILPSPYGNVCTKIQSNQTDCY